MCVAGEEEIGGSSVSGGSVGGADIPTMHVIAPRIGIDMLVHDAIDWTEVLSQSTIGLGAGLVSGGLPGGLAGQLAGAAAAIEGQDGIDLVDLFETQYDRILIPGAPGPYTMLH